MFLLAVPRWPRRQTLPCNLLSATKAFPPSLTLKIRMMACTPPPPNPIPPPSPPPFPHHPSTDAVCAIKVLPFLHIICTRIAKVPRSRTIRPCNAVAMYEDELGWTLDYDAGIMAGGGDFTKAFHAAQTGQRCNRCGARPTLSSRGSSSFPSRLQFGRAAGASCQLWTRNRRAGCCI
jgi:hypothetical protein